jgi:diadenylate cyclase
MEREIYRMFCYGSIIRNAVERITKAGRGALMVFCNKDNYKKVLKVCKGGFKVNKEATEELLAELAKLDGAIIINDNKIMYANVFLAPNPKIASSETGIRHQTAERMAKQFNTIVLAVSERTKIATVYYKDKKIKLNYISELLIKARETFTVLDRHRLIFERLIKNLNTMEILEMVSIKDIADIFQRKKIIDYIASALQFYLAELGNEGRVIEFQFKEIKNFVDREIEYIKMDYENQIDFEKVEKELEELEYLQLINREEIYKIFESNKKVDVLMPYGYRILFSIPILNEEDVQHLVSHFKNLRNILLASEKDLTEVKGIGEKKSKKIKEYLQKI